VRDEIRIAVRETVIGLEVLHDLAVFGEGGLAGQRDPVGERFARLLLKVADQGLHCRIGGGHAETKAKKLRHDERGY
jgi:hypothetical protein